MQTLRAVAAWTVLTLVLVFTIAGAWAMYDDCLGEDDYNVICRKSYMAINEYVIPARAYVRASVKGLLVELRIKSP